MDNVINYLPEGRGEWKYRPDVDTIFMHPNCSCFKCL
ncbi:hypothetical protein Gogos_019903 [Gossypium gossypioides]|uniref:Uncharacterized protein n=1 Tax=Gossypium gossypioides TaxID=34282 RepID=A0A7J9D536_GOSGO|nr:hypothetical protein [Gossypium gossypioides]